MEYNKPKGFPHTFQIPCELWSSIRGLTKKSKRTIQDVIESAVDSRTHGIMHNQADHNYNLTSLNPSKNITVRAKKFHWDPFKIICKKENLTLHRQFLIALIEYEKELRREYVNGL